MKNNINRIKENLKNVVIVRENSIRISSLSIIPNPTTVDNYVMPSAYNNSKSSNTLLGNSSCISLIK